MIGENLGAHRGEIGADGGQVPSVGGDDSDVDSVPACQQLVNGNDPRVNLRIVGKVGTIFGKGSADEQ